MRQVEISELPQHIASLLAAVGEWEEVILTRDNRPVTKLVQIQPRRPRRKAGSAKGLIKMAADFDEPLADFADYMP